jgi:lipoprotein-anchoring transpeptidase ErfK/SrfK
MLMGVVAALALLAAVAAPRMLQAEDESLVFASGAQLTNEYGFLRFWNEHQGEALLGMAITEPLVENGLTVQYFERGRAELHSELDGSPVLLGRVGADYAQALYLSFDQAPATIAADALPFAATGYAVAGPFRTFWEANAGMTMLGFPLSAPMWEYVGDQVLQVQYFERGRLEHHPLNAGTPAEVQMSNLGRELALLRNVALATPATTEPVVVVAPAPAEQAAPVAPVARPAAPVARPAAPAKQRPAARKAAGGAHSIVVDISSQHLYAYEGDTVVFDTAVSTGRDGFNTPTGNFAIYAKLPMQTMEGTIGGEHYRVPNIPNVMYINGGVALHGTYWHHQFGIRRMSHGCVNLPLDAAAWIYRWAGMGTPVSVVP